MGKYGLPFQGSKSKLAERIVDLLPSATHLYDLFAGGCALTHCALESGKWETVHFNDISDSVVLFKDCLEGNIHDGSEWISREEFYRRKDADPYVRLIWSFGNNQRDYLYSRQIEPYKKAVHEMIYAKTPRERRLKFREVCRLMPTVTERQSIDHESSERAAALNSLKIGWGYKQIQHQERQEALCRLSNSEKAEGGAMSMPPFLGGGYEMSMEDYRDVEILPDSVIYCDIPYRNTREYRNDKFDHEAFYAWALNQTTPLFISEYWMPEEEFVCVAEFERVSTFSATNNSLRKTERIFRPRTQL